MDDDRIRKALGLPKTWNFVAHLPFGMIIEPSEPKEKNPIDEMLIIK